MDSGSYLLLPGEQSKVQPRKKERSSEEKYIGHAVIKSEFVAGRNEMWNRDLADCTCTLCTRSHSRSHLGGAGQTVNFVEWSAVEWKRRSGALSNCGGGMPDDPPPFQRFHCGGTTFDCGHDKRTIDRSIHPSIDRSMIGPPFSAPIRMPRQSQNRYWYGYWYWCTARITN